MFERRRVPSSHLKSGAVKEFKSPGRRRNYRGCRFLILFVICTSFWFTTSTLIRRQDVQSERETGIGACLKYKGILLISQGDVEGAAGTIFFLFLLNQILYAEKYSLIPWIHLNNVSRYVYDPRVHGKEKSISFDVPSIVNASWTAFFDPISKEQVPFAGEPSLSHLSTSKKAKVTVHGNGVWNSYFYPVSRFTPDDPSCTQLPVVRLTHRQIIPALHVNCPWSLRAWRYGGLPPSLRNGDYNDWFLPMRETGADLVEKYIKFLPYLYRLAQEANPFQHCLALHIRHSDKANRRRKIPVKLFLPYVQAFVEEYEKKRANFSIYIATDSHHVIHNIKQNWPKEVLGRIRWQDQAIRSNDTTPVFTLSSHHITNEQVFVDIIAMQKCQFLLHGLSAVSEATHYLNRNLHKNHSVNLELQKHISVDKFRAMVKEDFYNS